MPGESAFKRERRSPVWAASVAPPTLLAPPPAETSDRTTWDPLTGHIVQKFNIAQTQQEEMLMRMLHNIRKRTKNKHATCQSAVIKAEEEEIVWRWNHFLSVDKNIFFFTWYELSTWKMLDSHLYRPDPSALDSKRKKWSFILTMCF